MIVDILTEENKDTYINVYKFDTLQVPVFLSGYIKKEGIDKKTGNVIVNNNIHIYLKNGSVPPIIYNLITRRDVMDREVNNKIKKLIVEQLLESTIERLNFEISINLTFVGANVVRNGQKVTCLTSLGNIIEGVVEEDKFIKTPEKVFLLSTVLIIE